MSWVKTSDEGSESPFMARMYIGILELRDQIYLLNIEQAGKQVALQNFNKEFNPVFEAARTARDSARRLLVRLSNYETSVKTGTAIKLINGQISVEVTIDNELSDDFKTFVDQSVVAIKSGIQSMLRNLWAIEIGFLFKKEDVFKREVAKLQSSGETDLANYLLATRLAWCDELVTLRNDMQHSGWTLERMDYFPTQKGVLIKFPAVNKIPIGEYVERLTNRVLLFIETMIVYGMQKSAIYPLYLSEIPKEYRNELQPLRFQISAVGLSNSAPWVICYFEAADFIDATGNTLTR